MSFSKSFIEQANLRKEEFLSFVDYARVFQAPFNVCGNTYTFVWRDSPYIDISHAASILHHDEYSLSYIASILKTPSTIIDVGAHTGWFSLLSKIVFPEARVIGIEPLHTNIQFLQYNALKNNLEIECIEKAIIGKADKIVNGCMTRNSPGHTTL
jgi:hypothetical protein